MKKSPLNQDPTYPTIQPVGEDGVLVEYEPLINLKVNAKVRQIAYILEQAKFTGVTEIVPAYRSLMVYFDPAHVQTDKLCAAIRRRTRDKPTTKTPKPRLFRIPTIYDTTHGPDLQRVADTTRMTPAEVIQLFSTQRYPVYCLGFLCGLAYMGGVPKKLHLPRLTTPRTLLPAGSVGFAGGQTVVLPIDQPSGWHYIGRTFVTLYDPTHSPPTPIRPGDLVECPSVSYDEARAMAGRSVAECVA